MRSNLSVFPIAPSSPFEMAAAMKGVELLRSRGFNVVREPALREQQPEYLNGSDEQRSAELSAAFCSGASLMWMARGGYGLTRLLPLLELPSAPTPLLVGFSDTTALHCHLWKHKGQKGIHAPNLTRLNQEESTSLEALFAILSGQARSLRWPALQKVWWPSDEVMRGPLVVANLCVLTHLIGTKSMPNLEGAILLIEDIGERPYRIDRMLTQLWSSNSLKGVRAIIMGQFSACEEPNDKAIGPKDVVLERCRSFQIPLCDGLPVGHDTPNFALPFGAMISLTSGTDSVEMRILEEIL